MRKSGRRGNFFFAWAHLVYSERGGDKQVKAEKGRHRCWGSIDMFWGLSYMTFANSSDFFTPSSSPSCLHSELIYTGRLKQHPLLLLLFEDIALRISYIEALLALLRSRTKIEHLGLFHTISTTKKYKYLNVPSAVCILFCRLTLTHSLDLPRQSARVPHSGRRCRNYSAPKVHRPTGMRRFSG